MVMDDGKNCLSVINYNGNGSGDRMTPHGSTPPEAEPCTFEEEDIRRIYEACQLHKNLRPEDMVLALYEEGVAMGDITVADVENIVGSHLILNEFPWFPVDVLPLWEGESKTFTCS